MTPDDPRLADPDEALARGFALLPNHANWRAARRRGLLPEGRGVPAAPLLLDVTDLLAFVHGTGRVTGIQRVQLGLVTSLLADPAERARIEFVFVSDRGAGLWRLDPAGLAALARLCLEGQRDASRLRRAVDDLRDQALLLDPRGAEAFVIAGAFWYFAGATFFFERLQQLGVRVGPIIYDLIPLTHPEHTEAATAAEYRRAFVEGAVFWDFALAISRHSAADLARQLRRHGQPAMPIRSFPLAHRFSERPPAPAPDSWPSVLSDLRGQDFILCVGTIESRKNHLALFQAWQILLAERGDAPPLVLVGRPGWRVDDLLQQFGATQHLGGRVRVVDGLSDPELEALYRGCLFTVFPSFTEGWGLPVGEALCFGKVCLASTEGATPEAGEGFAEPIDPFNPRGIAARVRHFLDDRHALAAAERRIRDGFRPRGWPEVTRAFLAAAEECLKAPARIAARLPLGELPVGTRLALALTDRAEGEQPAALQALQAGFETPETHQTWIGGRSARIGFRCPGAPEGRLSVLLIVHTVPWAEGNTLRIEAAPDAPVEIRLAPAQVLRVALPAEARPDGSFRIDFHVGGPIEPAMGEVRLIRAGVAAIRLLPRARLRLETGRPLALPHPAADGAEDWRAPLGGGCGAAHADGVDLTGPLVRIGLALPPDAADRMRMVLQLRAAPSTGGRIGLAMLGHATDAALPPEGGTYLLALDVGRPGVAWPDAADLVVTLPDALSGAVRLASLRWLDVADLDARLAALEDMVFPGGAGAAALGARLARLEAV
ncbi:MAG: glycosyltransferase family 4 protein, partial [Acetobacteraceae bacterium]|nr:glycosyltransferase family 4 protein [Acetobacteraceae bacterium]